MSMKIAIRTSDLVAGSLSEEFDLNVKHGKVNVLLSASDDGGSLGSCALHGITSQDGAFVLFKIPDDLLKTAVTLLEYNYLNYVVCNYIHDASGELCGSLRAFVGDSLLNFDF